MKTEETLRLERAIRLSTGKLGTYGCFEVTIGTERVDYMTVDTKGVWRCYEVKVSKADFHSPCAKTFCGNYNYFVMPDALYEKVKDEIPEGIGVSNGHYIIRPAKKRELGVEPTLLQQCMLRSLYRDADKLYETGNEHKLDDLKREANAAERKYKNERAHYNALSAAIWEKYGYDAYWQLEKQASTTLEGEENGIHERNRARCPDTEAEVRALPQNHA